MIALLWFRGIAGGTSMRDIGWSYVSVVVLCLLIAWEIIKWRRWDKKR